MTPEERADAVVMKHYPAGSMRSAILFKMEKDIAAAIREAEADARRAALAEAAGDCPVGEDRLADLRRWYFLKVVAPTFPREEVGFLLAALDHARARVALLLNDSEAYQAGLERGGAEERARVLALIAGRQRIGLWRVLDRLRLRQAIDPDAYVQCPDCSGTGDETSDGDGTCRRCHGTGKTPKEKPTT